MDQQVVRKENFGERLVLWALPIVGAFLALSFVVLSPAAFAVESENSAVAKELSSPAINEGRERWGVSYENDFFVPGGSDRDYTFGLAFSYNKPELKRLTWHKPLNAIERALGFKRKASRSGFEAGFYGFTPADKLSTEVNKDDRPFSSLVYAATTQERLNPMKQEVIRSQVSFGVLGLSVVGDVQEEFHALIGNDEPQGWNNQVSDGGELTARYAISKQTLIGRPSSSFELRETRSASVGYLTEATWGLSLRAGRLNSSWHEFNPDVASYAESSASASRGAQESFFWAGAAVKARAYNAFLQGQFRDSAHTYSADELNHFIVEAWLGYTHSFETGYFLSYGLRGHTSEVKEGIADRDVIWGGLKLGRKTL